MLNKIFLQGRLTKEPELRTTQNGKNVCTFTLAVDRDFDRSKADFIQCVAWGMTAGFVSKNFTKGQMMIVTGSLQSREYLDREDKKHTVWEVQVEGVQFCGSRPRSAADFDELADDEEVPF